VNEDSEPFDREFLEAGEVAVLGEETRDAGFAARGSTIDSAR
jgi:hypothetical protein